MSNVNLFCFFASYMLVLGLELHRFVKRSEGRRIAMLILGFAGLAAHTLYILDRSRQANLPPLLSSSYDWLLVLAWIIVAFYLYLTVSNKDLPVGIFLLPVVQLLLVVAYVVNPPAEITGEPSEIAVQQAVDRWSMLHSVLLVFGIAGIILGLMHGMMYLVQHRRLKHGQVFLNSLRLPSLERLASLNWWSIVLAVPLLSLGLLTGVILILVKASRGEMQFSWFDPAVVVSLAAWLVMAAFFLWLLKTDRPDGKQVASLTIWSFGFVLVTFLVQVMVASILGGTTFHMPDSTAADPETGSLMFPRSEQHRMVSREVGASDTRQSVMAVRSGEPAIRFTLENSPRPTTAVASAEIQVASLVGGRR